MKRTIEIRVNAPVEKVFETLRDLVIFQTLLGFVDSVEPETPESDSELAAWQVTLRARIGPLSRMKRLRMVRTKDNANSHIIFSRQETDGKEHADWVLNIGLISLGAKEATITIEISYRGKLWNGSVDKALQSHIESAQKKLDEILNENNLR